MYAPVAVKSVRWLVMALVIYIYYFFNVVVRIFDTSSERITREGFVTLGGR
jgi:hypothetical protein